MYPTRCARNCATCSIGRGCAPARTPMHMGTLGGSAHQRIPQRSTSKRERSSPSSCTAVAYLSIARLLMLTAFALGPALTISVMEPALLSYRLLRIGFPAETRPALYGTVTFIGLVVASLAQPIMGHCSGSAQAWRRRTAFMTLVPSAPLAALPSSLPPRRCSPYALASPLPNLGQTQPSPHGNP